MTADRIVLRREGASGGLATVVVGNSIWRILFVYGLMALSLVGFAVYLAAMGRFVLAVLPLVVAALLLRNVIKSRHFSAAPEILRDAIDNIEVHEPRPGATRGYFLVHFRIGDSLKKRIIMLPGSMSGGNEEFRHALEVLRNHGLISNDRTSNTG